MAYNWPSGHKAGTTTTDAATDRIDLARADIQQNIVNVNEIIDIWKKANQKYKQEGYPYEIKCNKGKNWEESCKFCYYKFNNKLLYTVANEMKDKDFP